MKLYEYIPNCNVRPKYLGYAWMCFEKDGWVCILIPFNWIARWLRDFYYFIAVPKRKTYIERLSMEIYRKAHNKDVYIDRGVEKPKNNWQSLSHKKGER